MKQKSKFTPELQAEIKNDIEICERNMLIPKETQSVFYSMKAKYEQLYPHICDNICFARTAQSDYVIHLKMLKGALEGILLNKTEPQATSQQAVNIYIKTFKNNGNIGKDNQIKKSNELSFEISVPKVPKVKLLKKPRY